MAYLKLKNDVYLNVDNIANVEFFPADSHYNGDTAHAKIYRFNWDRSKVQYDRVEADDLPLLRDYLDANLLGLGPKFIEYEEGRFVHEEKIVNVQVWEDNISFEVDRGYRLEPERCTAYGEYAAKVKEWFKKRKFNG